MSDGNGNMVGDSGGSTFAPKAGGPFSCAEASWGGGGECLSICHLNRFNLPNSHWRCLDSTTLHAHYIAIFLITRVFVVYCCQWD